MIPGRVIPKSQKMVLDATLPNTQHYKVRVKWSNPGKVVAVNAFPMCMLTLLLVDEILLARYVNFSKGFV